MAVQVVISEYIDGLKETEARKSPHKRRVVPSFDDLARAAGSTLSNYYKFAGNRTRHINRDFVDSSIALLRSCGFDTQIQDILAYTSSDETHS